MSKFDPSGYIVSIAAAVALVVVIGCASPAEKKAPPPDKGKHVYKDLKADIYPIPAGVEKALPGLQNDNIYIYREIAPTLNLVVYTPDYSLAGAESR